MSTMTRSLTDTFTEARARYIMGKIFDDFNSVIFRGFTTSATTLRGWRDDVQFVMERDALHNFELQFTNGSDRWVLRYEVSKNGSITRDDNSGGLDLYSIPSGARVNIVVEHDHTNTGVNQYLEARGWGTGGVFIAEDAYSDRAFSKEGFGVNRKLLGQF